MSDAPQLVACLNDQEVLKTLSNTIPNPYHLSDAEWFINHLYPPDKKLQTHFAMTPITHGCTNEGKLVGVLGFDLGPDVFVRTAEVGYWLARAEWGKGYVPEAVGMAVDWAFQQEHGLNGQSLLRVSSNVYDGNEQSKRVLEKCGFVFEGRMRDAVWKNSKVADLLVFGLTRSDWEKRKSVGNGIV
jgi:[ribosomal protein S5]-alanine N-acetyltransferase